MATLCWTPIPVVYSSYVGGQRIYHGQVQGGPYVQAPGAGIDVGKASTHTISGLPSGRNYFIVRYYDSNTGQESDASSEIFKDIP